MGQEGGAGERDQGASEEFADANMMSMEFEEARGMKKEEGQANVEEGEIVSSQAQE